MFLLILELSIIHRDKLFLRDLNLSSSLSALLEDEKNLCDWPLLTPAPTPPAHEVFLQLLYSLSSTLRLAAPCNTNTGSHKNCKKIVGHSHNAQGIWTHILTVTGFRKTEPKIKMFKTLEFSSKKSLERPCHFISLYSLALFQFQFQSSNKINGGWPV